MLLSLPTGSPFHAVMPTTASTRSVVALRRNLLNWFDANQRVLPWRESRDPYRVWISEIMLQQTRVATVIERYQQFMVRFPSLLALALAPVDDVLALWSGLGYYRRARMLHKAAQFVAETSGGNLPATAAELRLLPGIGDYTAAAIASIAHNEPIAVVDGNVERFICRLCGWDADSPEAGQLRKLIRDEANRVLDPAHPGQFNQAMMELGALVCTPRSPQCTACPVFEHCKTHGEHKMPARPAMKSQETAHALIVRGSGLKREILLSQRAESESVMPGLWELPMLASAVVPEAEERLTLRHTIMQTRYYARIRELSSRSTGLLLDASTTRWCRIAELPALALTGLTRKALMRLHLVEL